MILDKGFATLILVLFTALHVLAEEPKLRPGGPPPGFRPPLSGTEAQCESCDKPGTDFSKLKLAAKDIEDKAKVESDELEEEMRRILEKRKDRLLKKIDSASCPQPGRESGDLELQKLVRSFEMDSSDGKLPDRDSFRDREKAKELKKPAFAGSDKKLAVLQMRMKDEIEEAVEDKKETCARRARLKEYETDGNSKPSMNAGNNMVGANSMTGGNAMNTNQALMMMAAMSRMNGSSSMGMGNSIGGMNTMNMGNLNMMGGMGSLGMGMNYANSIYGGGYPSSMSMQSQWPYSTNQLSSYSPYSYGSSYPYIYGNTSSYGASFPFTSRQGNLKTGF